MTGSNGDSSNGDLSPSNDVMAHVVMALAVAGLITALVVPVFAGPGGERQQFVEESSEWCDQRDGTLVNVAAFGDHGGLHCELPNGTSVHMDDVVSVGGAKT